MKKFNPRMVQTGDIIGLSPRQGGKDFLVVKIDRITRGKNRGRCRFHLAPMIREGKVFGCSIVGEHHFVAAGKSWSKKEIDAARNAYHGTERDVADAKKNRADKWTNAAAEKVGIIKAGDDVLIDYSDVGPEWRKVAKPVNPRTGKVGIVVDGAKDWNAMIERGEMIRAYDSKFRPVSVKKMREVRWIPATLVIEVRAGN